MKSILIGMLLLAGSILRAAHVSGFVTDAETGETIIGANILVVGSDRGATTDVNGFFIILGLPSGQYELLFSHIGYEEYTAALEVGVDDIFLDYVTLTPAVLETETVTVSAQRSTIIQKDMDISSFQVNPRILSEVPQFQKDVFELIKYSPSVTVGDRISPIYYVRGGDAGENLVQLDGMTIYNPQHLLSMSAVFNPYAIKDIELLVGGFDAKYGGRNSSILHIASREGHKEKIQGEFKPSTSGIVGAIEFPVRNRGTAMISGRLSTDLVSRVMMGMPNLLADFNGSFQTRFGKTRLRVSAFYAHDFIDYDFIRLGIYFDQPFLRDYSTGFLTNTTNRALGVQTLTILTPNMVLETHFYHSAFRVKNTNFLHFRQRDDSYEGQVDVTLNYQTRVSNRISDYTAKASLTWYAFLNQTLQLGVETNALEFENSVGIFALPSFSTAVKTHLLAVYAQDKIAIGPLLLKLGARQTRFSPENIWRVEPRVSLALNMKFAVLKTAWGHYNQYITVMNTQDAELSQFLDYYYPLTSRAPTSSTHNIVSLEGRLSETLEYSITGYYKDLTRLYRLDYLNTVSSILSYDAGLEVGSGEAYGLEFLVRGDVKRISGWVSYSWSRSLRSYPSIRDGEPFLNDGDQTHNLKAVMLMSLTQDITASSTLQITSGFPKTWETGLINHYDYDPLNNTYGLFPEYVTPQKNNVRFPPAINWEIGWKKKLRKGFGFWLAEYLGSDEAYLTTRIQNLLFLRRNPYMYFYLPGLGYYGMDNGYFPSARVGYSIKF